MAIGRDGGQALVAPPAGRHGGAEDGGAESGGAENGGAENGGAENGGATTERLPIQPAS